MSDIPEDVMKVAEHFLCAPIADEIGNSLGYFLGRRYSDKAIQVIARAILQERERCAQIAETPRCNTCGTAREPNSDDCCPWPDLECANRHDIAAAIRSKP